MKNFGWFIIYFLLSGLITWVFVSLSPMYISNEQMLLSTFIAGAKWAIQIGAALLFLKEKSFLFLRRIGFVLHGFMNLIPYIVAAHFNIADGSNWFIGSLVAAVVPQGTFISRTNSVIAMANTPSLNASMRVVSLFLT